MLVILLNWALILYLSFITGFFVRSLLLPDRAGPCISLTVIWGLCTIATVATVALFFVNAGPGLLLGFVIATIAIHFKYRHDIAQKVVRFRSSSLTRRHLVPGCLLVFSLLVFSAQSSKINDDGFYYTQTVMWFSEQGLTKGISNLLLPLGLGSSWHVLQSLFSFGFIDGIRLNDLNGFFMLLLFLFFVENGRRPHSLLLALAVSSVAIISVPFLSASSPDLPIIALVALAFYLLISEDVTVALPDIIVLSAFAFTIKLSAVPLVLLTSILVLAGLRRRTLPRISFFTFAAIVVLSVLAKNVYQTGYPFYPYPFMAATSLPWATPVELAQLYTSGLKSWGIDTSSFFGPAEGMKDLSLWKTISSLMRSEGIRGVINSIVIIGFPIVVVISLLDTRRRSRQRLDVVPSVAMHFAFAATFVVWLLYAPQYRFILPTYIFYVAWLLNLVLTNLRDEQKRSAGHIVSIAVIVLLFLISVIPVSLNISSTSRNVGRIDNFQSEYLVVPHVSYSFPGMDTLQVEGREFYHVQGSSYCWDSPLPCLGSGYYGYITQRGFSLHPIKLETKQGFVLRRDR